MPDTEPKAGRRRHVRLMRSVCRPTAATALILCASVLIGAAPASAKGGPTQFERPEMTPAGGVIRVTGFDRISFALGSSAPVTVTVRGDKERAILRALKGLPAARPGTCVDTSTAFSMSFTDARTGKSVEVTGDPCPTPGLVAISSDGVLLRQQAIKGGVTAGRFIEDCGLARAVLAALPRHGVNGTRDELRVCTS